jgi:hypothetical protein
MDRLETLLSDTFTDRANQAPTGPVLLVSKPRWKHPAVAVLAACLVVVAVAAAVAALHKANPTQPAAHPPTTAQPGPPGTRLASYGDVSLRVPAGLATRTSLCGGPVTDEVFADAGAVDLCPVATSRVAAHPGTVVWLSSARQVTPYASIPTAPTQVDGQPARRGYASGERGLGAGVAGVVQLPAQGLTIGVTTPTRAMVSEVLASIRIASMDPLGCAANSNAATKTAAGPPNVLVPGRPTSVVRCEYGGGDPGMLIGSYLLDHAKTVQLVAALNDLSPDPCHCAHGGTGAPGHGEVLYFHYDGRASLRVDGSIGANLDNYSNRTRTVANYSDTVDQLLARLSNQH